VKLSFVPGKLNLDKLEDGFYSVTVESREVFRSRSQKLAIARFNELRLEMETRFPAREPSAAEKAQAFQNAISDWMVKHNSLGGRKKKTSAKSTRTFGG
jgi:hypothetical protein